MSIYRSICKFVFSIYLIVWWAVKQAKDHNGSIHVAFSCILVLAVSTLMITQVWGAWIVWKIALQVQERYAKEGKEGTDPEKTPIHSYTAFIPSATQSQAPSISENVLDRAREACDRDESWSNRFSTQSNWSVVV